MNQPVFPPVLIGKSDLTPCELAVKQTSWGSKLKSFFKQVITYTVLASLQLGTLVQTKDAYAQYVQYGGQPTNGQAVNGQPNYGYVPPTSGAISGYTNDGTLFMGGQRIGNPHQILHDAQIPSFMTITANRYTYTNDPTHGQGTLAQMELATTNGSDSSVILNRLYLSPTNPYVQGAPGPYPNYQTYQGVLANAQQANYLLTNADDGKTYAFKTLTASSRQAVDLLIRELPNTPQFRAAADPLGGGTGVRVTQNGDAVALAAYLATVKPYDYSWQPNFGTAFGQNPAFSGWANSNNFAPDYSEGAGPAQSFQAFIKQLQDDAVANDKKVRSQTSANSLDLSGVNPNSLFGEGYNLFQYGSNSNPNRDLENDFLRRLQSGQLTAGSADYLEASRIAQERYRIAYATRLETNKPLQYSMADAQRKANELKLNDVNPNELFGQGFDLFQFNKALRANGEAENVLLARLQNGELTPGSSEYAQATQIAQERLRQAYSLSLSPPPPKSVSKWKLIAGVVVGAILTFVTAGALAPFVGSALTGMTVAATTTALTVATATVAAGALVGTTMATVITAISGVIAGAIGAIASTTITTGSLSQGLKAGGQALVSGSVKAIVGAAIGFSFASLDLLGTAGTITETVSNIAVNTLSGAVSSTILGGGSFADNLKTSAISSVVDAVGKSAANAIGDAFPNSNGTSVANYAAHAVLGCATAAAKGGDCASGAIGAAAGEAAAATGFVNWAAAGMGQTLTDNGTVFFSGLIGGTVAAAAGSSDKVESNFTTGTATATNAVTNNYLKHVEINKLLAANKACGSGNEQACTDAKALNNVDKQRQQDLSACTGDNSPKCNGVRNDAADAMQGLIDYKNEIKKLIGEGKMSPDSAQPYLNKADREIKDVATHLKDDYYLKSGGVADKNNPDWIKYQVLEKMTNGQDLGSALTGPAVANPSEKALGKLTEVPIPSLSSGDKRKIEIEVNARRDDAEQYVNNPAPITVPETTTRKDNNFASPINDQGKPKASTDTDGNLNAANPDGTGSIQSHVRGGQSQDTPYISTTDNTIATNPKNYGSDTATVETRQLQRDLNNGTVDSAKTQIVPPAEVQANLQQIINEKQSKYDANPTDNNEKSLIKAQKDLSNAQRDGECLIKGCVPAPYIQLPTPQLPTVPTPTINPILLTPSLAPEERVTK